jgi:hypothetical protein
MAIEIERETEQQRERERQRNRERQREREREREREKEMSYFNNVPNFARCAFRAILDAGERYTATSWGTFFRRGTGTGSDDSLLQLDSVVLTKAKGEKGREKEKKWDRE